MLSRTGTLNVEEVDVVSSGVDHGPECHGVGNLPVEPDVLVGGEEPGNAGADNTDNVAQHRDENQATIECEDQTSTPRRPYRPSERVQSRELSVGCLPNAPLFRMLRGHGTVQKTRT